MAKRIGDKPNIIWIVVDSVRYYRSEFGDTKDKLEVMEKLAPEMIEFVTVITPAPSSIMSIGAMMTGIPSCHLARDYDTLCFDFETFHPLPVQLRKHGYSVHSIFAFKDARESFGSMLGLVGAKYWPAGLKYTKPLWTNDEINEVLSSLLEEGLPEPFFLYVHYNCRQDPQTSGKVEWAINRLKGLGLYDNSIFLLCSDHGYPDKKRGVDDTWFEQHHMTHDLLLTDDNIRIPLYLRYPGAVPRRIETLVSTLDLLPTLCDLLGIDDLGSNMHRGKSLIPLLKDGAPSGYQNRKLRSDCRLMRQSYRRTAVRSERYKYIASHDEGTEEFYDLAHDPFEENNLIDTPGLAEIIDEFKKELQRQEDDALTFHFRLAVSRVKAAFVEMDGQTLVKSVLVVAASGRRQLDLLLDVMQTVLGNCTIDIWTVGNQEPMRPKSSGYDLVAALLDTIPAEQHGGVLRAIRRIPKRGMIDLTANCHVHQALTRSWWFYAKLVYSRRGLYLREPELFWHNLVRKIKYTFDLLEHG